MASRVSRQTFSAGSLPSNSSVTMHGMTDITYAQPQYHLVDRRSLI
jgi:hypothetical protein